MPWQALHLTSCHRSKACGSALLPATCCLPPQYLSMTQGNSLSNFSTPVLL